MQIGTILLIIIVILLIYMLYKMYRKYKEVKETFIGRESGGKRNIRISLIRDQRFGGLGNPIYFTTIHVKDENGVAIPVTNIVTNPQTYFNNNWRDKTIFNGNNDAHVNSGYGVKFDISTTSKSISVEAIDVGSNGAKRFASRFLGLEIAANDLETGKEINKYKFYEDHIAKIKESGAFGDNTNTYNYANELSDNDSEPWPLATFNLGGLDELNEAEIYGLNEDGEPFRFFLIDKMIVPYIWRKDENNNEGWCQWYGEETNGMSCNKTQSGFSVQLSSSVPSWDTLVDATSDYLANRFRSLYLNIKDPYAEYDFRIPDRIVGDGESGTKFLSINSKSPFILEKDNGSVDLSETTGVSFSGTRGEEINTRLVYSGNGDFNLFENGNNGFTIELYIEKLQAGRKYSPILLMKGLDQSGMTRGLTLQYWKGGASDSNGIPIGGAGTDYVIKVQWGQNNSNSNRHFSYVYTDEDGTPTNMVGVPMHLVLTYDPVGPGKMFVNGTHAARADYVSAYDDLFNTGAAASVYNPTTGSFVLGNERSVVTGNVSCLSFRYIRFWDSVLSDTEIRNQYIMRDIPNPRMSLLNQFLEKYAQTKHVYSCSYPDRSVCDAKENTNSYFDNWTDCLTAGEVSNYCYPNPGSGESFIPYFDRYDNNKRQFFKRNKTNAAYDASLAMYDDIYDTSFNFEKEINFYKGWDGDNNDDMMTQVLNPDGRYGYNILQDDEIHSELPINRAASSVLTYNPHLNTYCGNVCFNGNQNTNVDSSASVM